MVVRRCLFLAVLLARAFLPFSLDALILPQIDDKGVTTKVHEMMKAHVTHKVLTSELAARMLLNYLDECDPLKVYFIEGDIDAWVHPADSLLEQIVQNFQDSNFVVFEEIQEAMIKAIHRRNELEKNMASVTPPSHVNPEEFKDMAWAIDENQLRERLLRLKGLQVEGASRLKDDVKEIALQRIEKRRHNYEEDFLSPDPKARHRLVLANVLKATASALDAHTAYFTPDEAEQFLIGVQQRLFGIGAALRDDLNGFTIVKIVPGGPAETSGVLKVKDRIIAVNGEPVVGLDITEAVELIRGEKGSPVTLTIVRDTSEDASKKLEQHMDIALKRDEVVLKETRLESTLEPFGDGAIVYLRLYSFYQDPESSSASDMEHEIRRLRDQVKIKGIILDLRNNSGGMLSQAVAVTGLFITKGVVVSIKDDKGQIQHLRDLNAETIWDGPLIVLTNRASASAAEIVAQALQDYGRGLIVGDDRTFGKGTFQTFTLNNDQSGAVNPQGEYKVTRGRYYTVSGKSPQLCGVQTDIVVPGVYSATDVGEKFSHYPLDNDSIPENFNDDLADIPRSQREKVRRLYRFDLQPRLTLYTRYLDSLRKNSAYRIEKNKDYQIFLHELTKKSVDETEDFGQNDLQLLEGYNLMKDLIVLML